jgi:flagellar protein FlaJ
MLLYKKIANAFPELHVNLLRARLDIKPEEYVQKTVIYSLYLGAALTVIIFMFTNSFWVFAFLPLIILLMFFYLFKGVIQKIKKLDAEISKEIVFAGRFLIIEMESGIPLYNSFKNIAINYKNVGIYFENIIEKVSLGTPLDQAINETIDICPSENLKKILWQILNSMKTGANISHSLSGVIENIVREQNITVKEFANKLNPLAMFYMMIAIIVPSLGVTFLIVMASFLQLRISLLILIIIALFISFVQFMFLFIIRNARPKVEM